VSKHAARSSLSETLMHFALAIDESTRVSYRQASNCAKVVAVQ